MELTEPGLDRGLARRVKWVGFAIVCEKCGNQDNRVRLDGYGLQPRQKPIQTRDIPYNSVLVIQW